MPIKRKTSHGLFTTLEEWRLPENIDDITHLAEFGSCDVLETEL